MWLSLFIAGCAWLQADLIADSVEPASLDGADRVRIGGAGFDAETHVTLLGASPLELDRELTSDTELLVSVPELAPGPYTLVVQRGEQRAELGLHVVGEVEEQPCERGYQANTQLSMQSRTAVVERFFPDGQRERVETSLDEIAQLELVSAPRADGSPCTAILLRKTDGAALLFEDDESDLRERAETLAAFMEKTLEVVD